VSEGYVEIKIFLKKNSQVSTKTRFFYFRMFSILLPYLPSDNFWENCFAYLFRDVVVGRGDLRGGRMEIRQKLKLVFVDT